MTGRCSRIATALASFAVAGLVLTLGSQVPAAEKPSEQQILNALKSTARTRGLTTSPTPQSIENQRFIDSLRTVRTRSLTLEERQKVTAIAREKPRIDLEIYFNFNSAEITPQAVPDLMTLGRVLTDPELRGGVFLIGGHTDAKGSDEYNQRLSERRAQSVKRFLTQKFPLSNENLVTAGYGEEQLKNRSNPLAAENRRVQIVNMEATPQASR
jgi:outer membrane protein OmpA-like peptidoglycan-associated protein